jgi:nitrilase
MANSLSRSSPEMASILAAVKAAGIFVVLGYSEREGGSIYMAQSFISPERILVSHRRKIKPTHVERTIWGDGYLPGSLKTVVDIPFGKVGALCCFEHYQPLLRYYQYSLGEQIHVASWPAFSVPKGSDWLYQGSPTASLLASRFMALEGQCFVIVDSMHLVELGVTDKVSCARLGLLTFER